MNHPEAAIAALYDHEQDGSRKREFDAPDWGGDELFSSTPRRRRFAADRQRRRETSEHPLPRLRPEHVERVHRAAAAPPVVEVPTPDERAEKLERLELLERPELEPRLEPSASGRRTVLVTGHPDRRARPFPSERRRPAPTVDQRIGHRPDLIAAWAFGLGLLLILIAVLTAH